MTPVVETTPDPAAFAALARRFASVPVTRRLALGALNPAEIYLAVAGDRPDTFLLETAESWSGSGRWSFVGASCSTAVMEREARPGSADGAAHDLVDDARNTLLRLRAPELPGLPPFAGGFAGYLGYDTAVRRFGVVPGNRDELGVPDSLLLWTTDLAAVDHGAGEIVLIANASIDGGIARASTQAGADLDAEIEASYRGAVARLDAMQRGLAHAAPNAAVGSALIHPPTHPPTHPAAPAPVSPADDGRFEARVGEALERIRAGEADQIVLSRRFSEPTEATPWECYAAIRELVPSAYMYRFRFSAQSAGGEPFDLIGCGPEPVATVREGTVRVSPIAGSRPRGATPEADLRAERELAADPKERAEHLMLVALAREDLAAVCEPGSVRDEALLDVVRYSTLMHLRSTVAGELAADRCALDAILACTPAGTVCGTPRASAAKAIEELEDTRRGVYGGAVGYLGHTGDAQAAIAIRAALVVGGTAHVQAGAGIVASSEPAREAAESRQKAGGVLSALRAAVSSR